MKDIQFCLIHGQFKILFQQLQFGYEMSHGPISWIFGLNFKINEGKFRNGKVRVVNMLRHFCDTETKTFFEMKEFFHIVRVDKSDKRSITHACCACRVCLSSSLQYHSLHRSFFHRSKKSKTETIKRTSSSINLCAFLSNHTLNLFFISNK